MRLGRNGPTEAYQPFSHSKITGKKSGNYNESDFSSTYVCAIEWALQYIDTYCYSRMYKPQLSY